MSIDGSFDSWNFQYCHSQGEEGYYSIIPIKDGVTVAAEPCSCPEFKILSTCEEGETCDDSGNCCCATGSCTTGEPYTPEAVFFRKVCC